MRGGLRQKCDATNQDTICGLAGELKLSLRTRLDQVHTCACVSKHAWDNRWVFWRVLLKWYHLGIQAPRIFDQLHAANIKAWRVCDFPGRSSPSCFPQSHVCGSSQEIALVTAQEMPRYNFSTKTRIAQNFGTATCQHRVSLLTSEGGHGDHLWAIHPRFGERSLLQHTECARRPHARGQRADEPNVTLSAAAAAAPEVRSGLLEPGPGREAQRVPLHLLNMVARSRSLFFGASHDGGRGRHHFSAS